VDQENLTILLQSEEDASGTDSEGEDGSDDNDEDYEYEETYTLTEWFPPDYWRSKLEDAKKMSMTMTTQDDTVSVRGEDVDADEYYYNLLKDKIRAAENVVVTDVTVDDSTVTFKEVSSLESFSNKENEGLEKSKSIPLSH